MTEEKTSNTKNWQPIPRVSRVIPFGYEVDPENDKILLPIVFELEALEKAREYVKRFPYRAVADWLTNITGRKLSYVGLKKRLEVEHSRRKRAAALKHWTKRYEAAKEAAREIEEEGLGATKGPND
jgi:hypothetical protein